MLHLKPLSDRQWYLVEKTTQHAIGETLGAIGEELRLSAEQVVYGVGGTVVGLGAAALAKKVPLPNKSKNSKRVDGNKNKDTETDNIDTKHNMTPEEIKSQSSENLKEGRASYLDYNENSKIMQEKVFKENSNI